jgi:hypothetical protein
MAGTGGGMISYNPSTTPAVNSNQPGFMPYDPTQSAAQNASNMITNQNSNYDQFMQQMPQYQATLNNQTIDQGNQAYNTAKTNIDTDANRRGLLYSGLKQGAEANAANTAANQTQTGIANNNANLNNYAANYGNQVANANSNYYAGVQGAALQGFQNQQSQNAQNQQFIGGLLGGAGTALGKIV